MKILFYSSKSTYSGRSFGGAEQSMATLASALSRLGHEVWFLTAQDFMRVAMPKTESVDGVKVYFLPAFRLPFLSNPLIRRLNEVIRHLILSRTLSRHFKRFDILYTYNEFPGLYQILKWRGKNDLKIKIVYRVAGLYVRNNLTLNNSLKLKFSKMIPEIDLANYNSEGVKFIYKDMLREFDFHSKFKNEIVLDAGVRLKRKKGFWVQNNLKDFTIVMVSRFSNYQKRHDLLIDAMKQWRNPHTKLLLFGDGPELSKCKEYCKSDEFLSKTVTFKGFTSQEELQDTLVNSDLFCLATDYEGLSKAFAEAMAVGIPILVSNVPALNYHIFNGDNGFLVENTVEAWVTALDKMYNTSKEELEALSKREIAYAKEHFDVEVNAKKYIEAFESLVQS